eukprot:1387838-Prymnesium_polylepis.2
MNQPPVLQLKVAQFRSRAPTRRLGPPHPPHPLPGHTSPSRRSHRGRREAPNVGSANKVSLIWCATASVSEAAPRHLRRCAPGP